MRHTRGVLTFTRILVPVDGSPFSTAAIAFAVSLAKEHGARLVLCQVVDFAAMSAEMGAGFTATSELGAEAQAILDAAMLCAASVPAECERRDGRPIDEILAAAAEESIDAIVMGTQGKRGLQRLALGSTTEGVLTGATVPVFTVHAETQIRAPFQHIFVGLDDTEASDAAVDAAIHLAQRNDSKLTLCSVVPVPKDAEDLFTHARAHAEIASLQHVVQMSPWGEPADEILRASAEQEADLIVVGTRAPQGLDRFIEGSVAADIVQRSKVPVMVVRAVAVSTNAQSKLTSAISPGV